MLLRRRWKRKGLRSDRTIAAGGEAAAIKTGQEISVFIPDESDFQQIREDFSEANSVTIFKRPACPAHDKTVELEEDVRNPVTHFLFDAIHLLIMIVFLLVPAWPTRVINKLVFRAPPNGYYYFLLTGKGENRKIHHTAKEVVDSDDLRICLPHLVNKRVHAVDVFYHVQRCKPYIIEISDTISVVLVLLSCEDTVRYLQSEGRRRQRSPYLLIFAQPNSSDLGCCLLMDPNFADMADFLRCDMLFFDYPGYGASDGKPGEKSIYLCMEHVIKFARETLKYKDNEIIIIGFSLGTSAAIHVASTMPDLGALILLAPFTSFGRVAMMCPNRKKPLWLDMFRSIEKAPNIKCPTLIVHGEGDGLVRPSHGFALREVIADCVIHIVPHTTHQGLVSERQTWDHIDNFLGERLNILEKWLALAPEMGNMITPETGTNTNPASTNPSSNPEGN